MKMVDSTGRLCARSFIQLGRPGGKRARLRLSLDDRLASIIATFPAAATRFFYYARASLVHGARFIPRSRRNVFH